MDEKIANSVLKNPLILALDVDDEARARKLAHDVQEIVGGFKLGPRLLLRSGGKLIRDLAESQPVFVDLKFFDIPSTMVSAVKTCFEYGASLVTVHALAGSEALSAVAQLEKDLRRIRPFQVLAVSVLTSWDEASVPKVFRPGKIQNHVSDLVDLATSSGLNGVVCSPEELHLFDQKNLYIVTPGIRLPAQEKSDQKRTMSPKEALQKGASAIVVGRPILAASQPVDAALEFLREIESIRK